MQGEGEERSQIWYSACRPRDRSRLLPLLLLIPVLVVNAGCGDDHVGAQPNPDASMDMGSGDASVPSQPATDVAAPRTDDVDAKDAGAGDVGASARMDAAQEDALSTAFDGALDVARNEDGRGVRFDSSVGGPAAFIIEGGGPGDPINTTEGEDTGTFTVKLNSRPTGTVILPLYSSNDGEGVVTPASLTFTSETWNEAQTVLVTGVNDNIFDGNRQYEIRLGIATGTDTSGYVGQDPPDLLATNFDDDNVGIYVIPSAPLRTSEAGGQVTFGIKLISEPTANVTVSLTSSDINEGRVSHSSVTFSPTTWNVWQQIVVTGIDDDVVDGDQTFFVRTAPAVAPGTVYDSYDALDVEVTNVDND